MSLEEAKIFVNKTYGKFCCSAYTILLEDGTHSGEHSTACYGGLSNAAVRNKKPIAVVNQLQTRYGSYYGRLPKGTAKAYLDWLINRSVFSDTFYEKDVDKILEEEIWVTRCDIPGNIMVAAMTCLRALTESDRSCRSGEVFLPLVQAGCTEEFAFVLGHFMKDGQLKTDSYDSHHCMFNWGGMKTGTVVNFLNKKFIKPRDFNFDVDKMYSGVHDLFSGGGSVFSTWLIETYKSVKAGAETVEKKETNPFQNARVFHGGAIKMDNDKFEVMAKICDLFYKEFVK